MSAKVVAVWVFLFTALMVVPPVAKACDASSPMGCPQMHHHWLLTRAAQLARLGALMSAERNLASMNPAVGNQVAAQMAAATALASNPDTVVQAGNFANISHIQQEISDNGLSQDIPDPSQRYQDMQKAGEQIQAEAAKVPSDAASMTGNKLFDGQGAGTAMSSGNAAWLGGGSGGNGRDPSGFAAAFNSAVPPQMLRDWSRETQAILNEEDSGGVNETQSLESGRGHALGSRKSKDDQDLDRLADMEKAYAAVQRGQYQRALDMLDRLDLGSNRGDAFGWYVRGLAEAGLKDRDGALKAFAKAKELDPSNDLFSKAYDQALKAISGDDLASIINSGNSNRGLKILLLILASIASGLVLGIGVPRFYAPAVPAGSRSRRRTPLPERVKSGSSEEIVGGVYKIARQIGAGGMGNVYEAFDMNLQRPVALKMMRTEIRDDARERQRFIKEAQTVAALHHPNIVGIHSIEEDGQDLFIVFEYVKGRTLAEVLAKKGTLEFAQALEVTRSVCDALHYAHSNGVVHRDLKPSNIMIAADGTVRVMDFGVARQVQDAMNRLSMTNTVCGTPPYMAPEIEQGIVGREADVYSLAVCFYELLTGDVPFGGMGAAMLLNKMNMRYRPLSMLIPSLPSGVDEVLTHALEAEPSKRMKSPTEFHSALAARYASAVGQTRG